jgi:DNA ligase (NAD+)
MQKNSDIEVAKLAAEIARHKALYYSGKAEISDEDFDKLEEQLKSLFPDHPVLQLVGTAKLTGKKIRHDRKMLSLEKTYLLEDVVNFISEGDAISLFKIDGSSCSLIFEDGKLIQAKTRGDGEWGEDITEKILYVPNIPKVIRRPERIEIRGEVYCDERNFHFLSEEMQSCGLEKPQSQRNIVAGLIGRKEHVFLCRHLIFSAFDIEGLSFQEEQQKLKKLEEFGFQTPSWVLHKSLSPTKNSRDIQKDCEKRIEEFRQFLDEGEYLVDGLVLSYNDLAKHRELGETNHHPRYKLAFKLQGSSKVTKIQGLVWQVSRNGVLTPVAEVEPVELSGAIISRVTLHNWGVVKDFNLKRGDEIEVVRSGEVIPKFLSVKKSISGMIEKPHECPSCGAAIREEEIRLFCDNKKCRERVIAQINHYIKEVEIFDLSEKRLAEMFDKKFICSVEDLYFVKKESLLEIDKIKEKLAEKIYAQIQQSKKTTFLKFVSGLGVEGLSKGKIEKLIQAGVSTLDKLQSLTPEQVIQIEGFADKSAREIIQGLNSKKEIIVNLLSAGVKVEDAEAFGKGVLDQEKICITGALSLPRNEMEILIKKNGGQIVSSVSKNTTILLTNETDSTSSKYIKAKQLNIPIVNELELMKRLGMNS